MALHHFVTIMSKHGRQPGFRSDFATMEGQIKTNPEVSSFISGIKYEHLVAGIAGGVVSTLLTHPFDLIKLRLAGL